MERPIASQSRSRAVLKKPALFFLAFYLAWTLRVVLLLPLEDRFQSEVLHRIYLDTLRILLWLVPLWIYLVRVERTAPLESLGLSVLPRGRRAAEAAAIAVAYFAVVVTVAIAVEGKETIFQRQPPLARWPMILFGMWAAPFIEEVFFRGFVFRRLRQAFRFQPANMLNAVLFASIHVPGWLYLQGLNAGMFSNLAGVIVIGWVLGLLMERTQSVWPPVAVHFINNLLWSG